MWPMAQRRKGAPAHAAHPKTGLVGTCAIVESTPATPQPAMKNIALALATTAALAHAPHALAQAGCSSDGAARPVVLFERFISADCASCWTDPATPAPTDGTRTLVLDWIVPGASGDEAPLSAASTRDALERLADLNQAAPRTTDVHVTDASTVAKTPPLRVASGPTFNDYVGTTMAWRSPTGEAGTQGPWQYHLLLVEAVPAGTEGTPTTRNLVRNMLKRTWDRDPKLSKKKQETWNELQPMRIAEGVRAEGLFVVGWVQDAQGRTVATARSVCR